MPQPPQDVATRVWIRVHGQYSALVWQHAGDEFSALGVRGQESAAASRGFRSVQDAQADADRQVQRLWRHNGRTEWCGDWSDAVG